MGRSVNVLRCYLGVALCFFAVASAQAGGFLQTVAWNRYVDTNFGNYPISVLNTDAAGNTYVLSQKGGAQGVSSSLQVTRFNTVGQATLSFNVAFGTPVTPLKILAPGSAAATAKGIYI